MIKEIGWIDFYLLFLMRQLIHSRTCHFFLASTVGKISCFPIARPFTAYVACPFQTNYHKLLKCIKVCKIRFLLKKTWEKKHLAQAQPKTTTFWFKADIGYPPKTDPRVFSPSSSSLKAWFWVNPEELQLTSNPLHQSTKSRLDVFPFFHFVEAKNPNHWLNVSFVSMT